MEKVIERFEELAVKEKIIRETIVVIPHKSDVIENIQKLSEENKDVKILAIAVRESLREHEVILKDKYVDTTETIKRVQLKMMHLLHHFNDDDKHKQTGKRALQEINIPGTPKLYERAGAVQAFSEHNTPRMQVSDYAKSPFTKKRTKVQLQFSDFEAEIQNEEFKRVPGYMKGRASLSELQLFLDTVVIKTFNDKYRTLHRHRSTLKPSEFTLQSMFKSQESYFEGQKFITVGDIARIIEKNVDKTHERYLQMLRHLCIIKESRKNSVICYIWLKK